MSKIESNKELNYLRNELNKNIKNISIAKLDSNISINSIDPEKIKPNTEVFVTTLNQNGIVVSNISKSNEVQVQSWKYKN